MSGGEQQRVALARALAPNPAILVADEPTGNLDEATGAGIIDLMFALKRDRGATLIVVTHDLALASKCERRIELRSGRIEDAAAAPAVSAERGQSLQNVSRETFLGRGLNERCRIHAAVRRACNRGE